ncbi:hypothetical protein CALCODRAFT_480470 [Calocera cornea HHB12733]|uniref:XRRM domain-containing protein n=1 Tax=Calocera cornea HHB12733 TaxID=1353952 RepID=A0A165IP16_9BASI|nr:hypothetical protein CALCODRAFT_480470 [Calocera cornea HHB12733]
MSAFAFLPRSVKGKGKASEPATPSAVASTSYAQAAVPALKAPRAPAVDAEDVRALFSMALSSYSMFVEPAARRLLDRDEFIRLAALISVSPMLANLPSGISEAQIVTALRELPEDARPDMRIGLHGYELKLRRKESLQYTHSAWEHRTVYVENVPVHARSMAAVHKVLCDLFDTPNAGLPSTSISFMEPTIQYISFPAAQNNRGQQERFQGFAFVVFRTEDLVQQFLERWPWSVSRSGQETLAQTAAMDDEMEDSESDDSGSLANGKDHRTTVELAIRSRLRTLSKADWSKLKAEYLAEHGRLFDLSRPQAPASAAQVPANGRSNTASTPLPLPSKRQSDQPSKRAITETQSYPTGCLVFARGLPAQTNKTALKAIFASALDADKADGVDYVDWTKGMDMCYVRFSTAHNAQRALVHFREARADGAASVRLELIDGERERIYWEKVPEHLRRQAAERALNGNAVSADAPPRKRRRAG